MRVSLIAFFALTLSAQDPERLTLTGAMQEARAAHPQLQAASERIRAAQGLRTQAALRPNPRLFLQSENARFHGTPAMSLSRDTDNFAYLSQVFEVGGKRARRIEFADAATRSAELQRAVAEREVASRVSLAYWNAVAARSLRDLLDQNTANFDRVVEYHRNRVNEGAMAEVDLMRVTLERDRIAVTARNAAFTAELATIELLRQMGRTEFRPVVLTDALSAVRDITAPDMRAVLGARPELDSARQLIRQMQANLRLQQSVWKPDPEVLFGYKRTGGFDTLIGGLQLNLPFRNRNQGAILAAGADIRAAEAELALAEIQVRAEVEAAWTGYLARRRMLTETLEPMRLRAEEIARIAQAAYREGGVDLLRLLDAERARLEAMTAYFQALTDYQSSVTAVLIATGAEL